MKKKKDKRNRPGDRLEETRPETEEAQGEPESRAPEPTKGKEEDSEPRAPGPEELQEKEEMVPREKLLMALADLNNLRKRTAGQIRTTVQNERKRLLSAFLEVLDSLQLALTAHEGEHNEWIEGTRGIHRQMTKIFKDFGLEPIETLGQPFDPNLHEAVSQLKMPDRPDGTVVEELQRGYRFQEGTLLRPARVVVSRLE